LAPLPIDGAPSGVIWVSRYLQVAAEAIMLIDAHCSLDVGARLQAHRYLPAIFPETCRSTGWRFREF
jgi:hypothetical protein